MASGLFSPPTLIKMKETIYIIVEITYDWFRDQVNLAATTNWEKAIELATTKANSRSHNRVAKSEEESADYDDSQSAHIWIQKIG